MLPRPAAYKAAALLGWAIEAPNEQTQITPTNKPYTNKSYYCRKIFFLIVPDKNEKFLLNERFRGVDFYIEFVNNISNSAAIFYLIKNMDLSNENNFEIDS